MNYLELGTYIKDLQEQRLRYGETAACSITRSSPSRVRADHGADFGAVRVSGGQSAARWPGSASASRSPWLILALGQSFEQIGNVNYLPPPWRPGRRMPVLRWRDLSDAADAQF